MKKTYYATCVPGMEHAVENQLRRESGVVLEWSGEGAVTFRADQTPNFPYLHNVFLVLHTLRGLPDLDAAVKKLLLAGDWLDRMPFDALAGKRFRIVTMQRDQLVSVDMRYLALLEQVIAEHTGMRAYRERPDVELWLIRCGDRATVFVWRLAARKNEKASGSALRSGLCAAMAALAKAGGKSALCLGGEERLAQALRTSGCASVSSRASLAACAQATDASADALVGRVQPQGQGEARAVLLEVQRIVKPGGRAVLLAPEGTLSDVFDQLPGLDVLEHYEPRIGGRNHHLWVIAPSSRETDE